MTDKNGYAQRDHVELKKVLDMVHFFSNSAMKLSDIILFIYFRQKYSSALMLEEFHFSSRTMCDWSCFMRNPYCSYYKVFICTRRIWGVEIFVEIYETLLVKRKYNVGRIIWEK